MRWLALGFVGVVACCDTFAPVGAEPYTPPASFAAWWAEMEQCSGRSGDMRRVSWYVVPNATLHLRNGMLTLGAWAWPHDIYLDREVVFHTDGRPAWQPWAQLVVQHEMLHDLTGPDHGPVFDTCGVRSIR